MIFDFDYKLIGGDIQALLTDKGGSVESAPAGRQDKNGLAEGNWRSIVRMAHIFLASALLPTEYWWFAIKRATGVTNYLPVKVHTKLTTPFELVKWPTLMH
jgi:hypothetical protein